MVVPVCSRSKDIIEPDMKQQWYIKCDDMAKKDMESVDSGELRIIPVSHKKTMAYWMGGMRDWCISRQQVSEDKILLSRDPDVLDTWFSSGLFNFSVLGWPNKSDELDAFYPGSLLETGHDVIKGISLEQLH